MIIGLKGSSLMYISGRPIFDCEYVGLRRLMDMYYRIRDLRMDLIGLVLLLLYLLT